MSNMKVIISVLATITILLISPITSEISNGESVDLRRMGHNDTANLSSNLKIDHSFAMDNNYNITNLVRIGDILNVFRIETIGAAWGSFRNRVNQNCSKDLFDYIKGLEGGKTWAVKSESFFHFWFLILCCAFWIYFKFWECITQAGQTKEEKNSLKLNWKVMVCLAIEKSILLQKGTSYQIVQIVVVCRTIKIISINCAE